MLMHGIIGFADLMGFADSCDPFPPPGELIRNYSRNDS